MATDDLTQRREDAAIEVRTMARRLAQELGKPGDLATECFGNRVNRQAARLLIQAACPLILNSDEKQILAVVFNLIGWNCDDFEGLAEQWGLIEDAARVQREDCEERVEAAYRARPSLALHP